jgi:pimeloyl-ACP methyl ester carboxylesterase
MPNNHRSLAAARRSIGRKDNALETLIVDGRAVAYQDVGSGPTVILVHCSGASHHVWAPLAATLRADYRVLAPDLLGYGESEPWPSNAPMHPWSDLSALLALAKLADEPVHLVGHSYGGAVALEAARILGPRAKSLTLIEPAAFHLLKLTGQTREWQEITNVGRRMTEALRLRRDREAAGIYMRYWVGRMRWWTMSTRARRRAVQTVGKVGAEFEAILRLSSTAGDYQTIHTTTRLIAGQRTLKPARTIVEELASTLSDAHLYVLAGAGHMSPFTHPAAISALVAEHIDTAEARAGHTRTSSRDGNMSRRSIA